VRRAVADFCAGLRQLRAESKIPVAALAGRLDISRQHLHEVLSGRVKRPPDWDHIVAPLVGACTDGDQAAMASWRRRHEVLLEVWWYQGRADRSGPVTDFCTGLRELRAESRIPVAMLAGQLNVSRQHLYALLAGRVKRIPDWNTLVRPLVEACAGGDPVTVAAWRRRHGLMTAAWEQLGSDPADDQAAGAAAAGLRSTLPPDTAAFTGRATELELITAAVAEARDGMAAIRAIGGMPGVGKTAIAIHAAHLLAGEFPDRQLFVDLHGHTPGRQPVTQLDALALLLAATGADPRYLPADVAGRSAMWRDRMAGQRAIVVLDNAASSAQLMPLLPGSAGCLVLVTSRRHLADLPGTVVPVMTEVLPDDEAVRLFSRLAPRAAADDPAAVADLTRLAGSLPLAVSLLARVYARHPSWSLADLAAEALARPLTMKAEQSSVAAAFEVSMAHLEPAWRRFFVCLGLHPGTGFDAHAAAALTSVCVADAALMLDALHGEGLLTETACRRYGMHDLIRRYARDRACQSMTSHNQDTAVQRLLDYYQHTADRAHAVVSTLTRGSQHGSQIRWPAAPPEAPRLTDDRSALAWLRAERASLLACLDYATARQMPDRIVALTAGIGELLRRDGPWAEAVIRHERAVQAAIELADKPGQASALLSLADARWLTGQFPAAATTASRVLSMFAELGDRLGEASASVLLADTQRLTGDYGTAARLLERALGLFAELGDRLGQGQALLSLGVVRRLTSDYRSAATAARQALGLAVELGRQHDQARALALLGDLRRDTGDYPGAITTAEQALGLYCDIGERCGQAAALWTLGAAQRAVGNYPAATSALVRALGIWQDLGNGYYQASILLYLGGVRRDTRDYPAARAQLGQALRILRDNGDRGGVAEALNEIGALHLACGELTAASHCHRQALDLARQIGSRCDEAIALSGLGRCASATATAERLLAQAHQILLDTGAAAADEIGAELAALASAHPAAEMSTGTTGRITSRAG
jgi:tetratricopeptide (TPR) repeat protein